MKPTVIVADNPDAVARLAAEEIGRQARAAIAARGRFTFAISGGTSVKTAYQLFAGQPDIDWTRVHLFFADDRFVEHDNPYSNYALADEAIFSRQPALPRQNIFAVPVDAATPADAAEQYDRTIRGFFKVRRGQWPRFDLAQIGLGPDGHTASLFPRSLALKELDRIAAMNHAGLHPWVDRITLTLPLFNHARSVLFLAHGAAKRDVFRRILKGPPNARLFPASAIGSRTTRVIWMVDRDLAGDDKKGVNVPRLARSSPA